MGFDVGYYEFNKIGKDYVVGDIHGEFRKLKNILEEIGFDFKKDRLFSVGDLCDRGSHSEDILKWIDYDWFIPVMGNHEVMILNHFYGYLDEDFMKKLKASWFLELKKEQKEKVVRYFNSLPVAIEIKNEKKKVGIVHAMCPLNSWETFKKCLYSEEKRDIANEAMWSFLAERKIHYVNDIDAVIVGHNTVPDCYLKENTYLLDTGSGYKTGRLSIFDIQRMELQISK